MVLEVFGSTVVYLSMRDQWLFSLMGSIGSYYIVRGCKQSVLLFTLLWVLNSWNQTETWKSVQMGLVNISKKDFRETRYTSWYLNYRFVNAQRSQWMLHNNICHLEIKTNCSSSNLKGSKNIIPRSFVICFQKWYKFYSTL